MKNFYLFIKYRNDKWFIKILLGIIFFYGNSILYAQDQEYFVAGDFLIDGTELVLYMGEAEYVIIPDNLGITRIGDRAFRSIFSFPNRNLKSVIIPEEVTSIGSGAFEECFNLTNIILPEGLISIGDRAFNNCRSLANIIIPESVTYIGGGAFGLCSNLESIIIPANVISPIGPSMFSWCTSLTNITADERNPNYSSSDGILFNKNKTRLIKYPAGKTEQTYIVPSNITAVSQMAFADSRLTNITIHENVNSIGEDAFFRCGQLVNITIDERNRRYLSDDGVLFNKDKTLLIKYPASKNERTYIIPSSVTVIGNRAFSGSRNLEYMTIPSKIVSIGDGAFGDCINLKTVVLSRNTRIGNVPYHPNVFRNTVEIIYSED
jgi:hypothetical protein